MTTDKPHHLGHRDRLRARFNDGGADALADYELLELLLFTAIPRKDVKPIAKDLIATFGTLHKMMTAPISTLCQVSGVGCVREYSDVFKIGSCATKSCIATRFDG